MTTLHEDEHRQLSDIEIDSLNMDIIDRDIEAALEYQETGKWTAFMGVVLDTPPVDTKLLPYSWER